MANKDLRPKPSPSLKDVKSKKLDEIAALKKLVKERKLKPITRQKRLDELDPIKPIPGGGFAPIGEPTAFKNGGSVRLARKGGGKAYGKNS